MTNVPYSQFLTSTNLPLGAIWPAHTKTGPTFVASFPLASDPPISDFCIPPQPTMKNNLRRKEEKIKEIHVPDYCFEYKFVM